MKIKEILTYLLVQIIIAILLAIAIAYATSDSVWAVACW